MGASRDERDRIGDERLFPTDQGLRNIETIMILMILMIFVLGVGNFALHKAVLESEHPLLDQVPGYVHMLGGKMSMITEFMILLAAMLLAANGWPALAWAYLAYSTLNGVAAWLILTDRI